MNSGGMSGLYQQTEDKFLRIRTFQYLDSAKTRLFEEIKEMIWADPLFENELSFTPSIAPTWNFQIDTVINSPLSKIRTHCCNWTEHCTLYNE